MDKERSDRLLHHLTLIKDMVDYHEVSRDLLHLGIISPIDHHTFMVTVGGMGNSKAMEDLVHTLTLRRGGYSGFVQTLRANGYHWLAERIEPEQEIEKIGNPDLADSLGDSLNELDQKDSVQKQCSPLTDFFPMDLGSSSSSMLHLNHCHSPYNLNHPNLNHHQSLSASFDNLKLDQLHTNSNLELNTLPQQSSVLLLNVPETGLKDVDSLKRIASEFGFPLTDCLTSLKRINNTTLGLKKKKKSFKLKFKCREARDQFVKGVSNLNLVNTEFGGVKVMPLDSSNTNTEHGGWFFNKFLKRR